MLKATNAKINHTAVVLNTAQQRGYANTLTHIVNRIMRVLALIGVAISNSGRLSWKD
ncbi:MAG: hypothetical protein PHD43_16945 [Methylococcales bacterium]|nr:hypothetical protein [Methylococcales bacterium]